MPDSFQFDWSVGHKCPTYCFQAASSTAPNSNNT